MAGTLKILLDVQQVSQYILKIQDLTQPYSATNLTGWLYNPPYASGPTPFVSGITSAILQVELSNGTITVLDVLNFATAVPLYDVLNSLIKNPYIVTPTMVGLPVNTPFPDGKTTVYLQVGGVTTDPVTDFLANPTKIVYFTKNVECCLLRMWKNVKASKVKCCDPAYLQYLQAEMYYRGILANVACGHFNDADVQLALLTELCGKAGCSSCFGGC